MMLFRITFVLYFRSRYELTPRLWVVHIIQSIHCLYLQNSLEFFDYISTLWPEVQYEHFYTLMVEN